MRKYIAIAALALLTACAGFDRRDRPNSYVLDLKEGLHWIHMPTAEGYMVSRPCWVECVSTADKTEKDAKILAFAAAKKGIDDWNKKGDRSYFPFDKVFRRGGSVCAYSCLKR